MHTYAVEKVNAPQFTGHEGHMVMVQAQGSEGHNHATLVCLCINSSVCV